HQSHHLDPRSKERKPGRLDWRLGTHGGAVLLDRRDRDGLARQSVHRRSLDRQADPEVQSGERRRYPTIPPPRMKSAERNQPMKRVICIVAGLMVFAVCAAAQAPTTGQKVGLAASWQNAYATLKGNLTQAAEKMPEANYGFKPAPDPDLRTFGQWIGHQTDNQ